MRIYLSIDLDFWENEFPQKYFEKVMRISAPKRLVISHEELLPHVNQNHFDTLVNVDFHSDLADLDNGCKPKLNDGTWGNHVQGSHKKKFVWSCPDKNRCYEHGFGTCHGLCNPFALAYRKYSLDYCGWAKVSLREKWLPVANVVAVGIALSPDYTPSKILLQFCDWFKRTNPVITTKVKVQKAIDRWIKNRAED